jgi:hypothetical protein
MKSRAAPERLDTLLFVVERGCGSADNQPCVDRRMGFVEIVVVPPARAALAASAHDFSCPAGSAFRAVPLLSTFTCRDGCLVAIGQFRILARAGIPTRVEVLVRALWRARYHVGGPEFGADRGGAGEPNDWEPIPDHDDLAAAMSAEILAQTRDSSGDPERVATALAKRLAEVSRDHVGNLRRLRYGLKKSLGDALRGNRGRNMESILADTVELSAMSSRAGDEAREATREGLWTWRSDSAAYWAHRHFSDATVVIERHHRKGHRRPWFMDFDHGVRHCRQMEALVGQETSLLHSLLNATSTIAVTRDAPAQENFNLLASVGAVLLGLPALVVALYGATAVLPISPANWIVLVPLGVAGIFASMVAALLPANPRRRIVRVVATLGATIIIIATLAFAGTLVNPLR